MDEFVYTVSLIGENVHCKHSIQCVIKRMGDLDKARDIIENFTVSNLRNYLLAFSMVTGNSKTSLTIEILLLLLNVLISFNHY